MKETTESKEVKLYITKRQEEFKEQLDTEKAWNAIENRIRSHRIRRWTVYATCVTAFILVSIGGYKYIGTSLPQPSEEKELISCFPEKNENKALLLLSNGNRVQLDSCQQIVEENVIATNDNKGILNYQTTKDVENVSSPNTLIVPRGGSYQLCLSDGTKVWLNAESSLTYPSVFGKVGKREVELVGEAYFEVTKATDRPFIVHTKKQNVIVLGTKFNLSAYPKAYTQTTLVEGKVCVKSLHKQQDLVLLPNQQAVLTEECKLLKKNVDAETYISWINGIYEFNHVSLLDITSQLSRWYNVEIQFSNNSLKEKYFTGAISRNYELGFALEIIQEVSNVVFNRNGKTIMVSSK